MLLVDTKVILSVLEDETFWADWSLGQLRAQAQVHELLINPIIYSELSLAFKSIEALDEVVEGMRLTLQDLPRPALFLAGQAFARYRDSSSTRSKTPSDFFIGAHAAVLGCGILTRNERRYRSYFPRVPLIAPDWI